MAQKGKEKQVPEDQRSRGMNEEHPEGRANDRNETEQKKGQKPAPGTTTASS